MTGHPDDTPPNTATAGDDDFAGTAGRMLRRSADELDRAAAARLAQHRQAALDQLRGGRARATWLVPAMSTAAVGALAVALWVSQVMVPDGAAPRVAPVESEADLDLLFADDSLEMLEELEFYAWLETQADGDEPRAKQQPPG